MPPLSIVILAAGKGTRMRSSLPKVLHQLASKPLLGHVLDTAGRLSKDIHVVYGHGGDQVKAQLSAYVVGWVEQKEQLGTGHAVAQPLPAIDDDARVLILYGDVPLISEETLTKLLDCTGSDEMGLLTATLEDPMGYGRIVRDAADQVIGIVEQKDATEKQLLIKEINTGIMLANASDLKRWIAGLDNRNTQGEYYLTDIIALAVADGVAVKTSSTAWLPEISGVNDRLQLSELERACQQRQAERLMVAGVTLADPARIDIRGEVSVGQDVIIDINVILEGNVQIGAGTRIGAHTSIKNSSIGENCTILANCIIEEANIAQECSVGPFARVRPGTRMGERSRIGNFVETKKAVLGTNTKINHLSYVGDATVGNDVNIGAGTITCNYDGVNKYQTVIEDGAFIGSDTQLVAPVRVGKNATVGAGTTLCRDAPENTLTLSRAKQKTVEGWQRPTKGGG